MAPQLDQGRQRRPQAVFFFIFFPGLSVSSCYCLGMLQFWHQSSEVTRPQEPSRSFSPMHCHYDSPLTRVPVTRARHSRHSHSHACEICRALLAGRRILLSLPGGSSQALVYLEINTRDDTQKTSNSIWGFPLTSTMTQYLPETWFYLTCAKDKYKPKMLRNASDKMFLPHSGGWSLFRDLLEAADYLILIFTVTKR